MHINFPPLIIRVANSQELIIDVKRERVRLLPFKRATTLGWQSMPRNPANGGKVYNIISIPAASCNIKSDQFHIQLILLNDVLNNVLVPPAKPTPTSLGGLVLLWGCFPLPAKPPMIFGSPSANKHTTPGGPPGLAYTPGPERKDPNVECSAHW